MKRAFSAFTLTFIVSTAVAQVSQNAYNFLRLPVSAHAAALGGDNITIIDDDASLMFHNPALLSSVATKTVGLNYMNYVGIFHSQCFIQSGCQRPWLLGCFRAVRQLWQNEGDGRKQHPAW